MYSKKSLGQNFLKDKNIISKILNLVKIKDKNIVEIGPGKGSLTEAIIKKKPKSLILIEKDIELSNKLQIKYSKLKKIKIYNKDILKFDIERILKSKSIIFGNLPYNISSQILVKFIKMEKWPPKYNDIIFMFQKELGEIDEGKDELSSLSKSINDAKMPKLAKEKCLSELKKLKSMSPMSAEATVVRNYLD